MLSREVRLGIWKLGFVFGCSLFYDYLGSLGEKGRGLESSLGFRVLSLQVPMQLDVSPVAV